ncbi:transmembrane protein, putative (macronuclear) [Tetrahymena thermophila SB210]|uniref:Transmembrane protein, putative n=1 Tax=Tetrahymena thermophila (strain SB210) TaxID=312017 RepID=W7X8W7_TETTS|nr:transmembrane protein, putative [Tetrahymena thermophila SB210]EWS75815.1 transmembrane protein, putative [Tetrahymena thermophila SB210]|eukprot:XP_012651737.1 transmembrane protein, putative [Tetrahymena thermophila SB210]
MKMNSCYKIINLQKSQDACAIQYGDLFINRFDLEQIVSFFYFFATLKIISTNKIEAVDIFVSIIFLLQIQQVIHKISFYNQICLVESVLLSLSYKNIIFQFILAYSIFFMISSILFCQNKLFFMAQQVFFYIRIPIFLLTLPSLRVQLHYLYY